MEIKTNDYSIWYDPEAKLVTCLGSLRLSGAEEYAPIVQLLNDVIAQNLPTLIINVQGLTVLNSAGINMLSRFVIKLRQHPTTQLIIQGSTKVPWQEIALQNFQRLLPSLQLELK